MKKSLIKFKNEKVIYLIPKFFNFEKIFKMTNPKKIFILEPDQGEWNKFLLENEELHHLLSSDSEKDIIFWQKNNENLLKTQENAEIKKSKKVKIKSEEEKEENLSDDELKKEIQEFENKKLEEIKQYKLDNKTNKPIYHLPNNSSDITESKKQSKSINNILNNDINTDNKKESNIDLKQQFPNKILHFTQRDINKLIKNEDKNLLKEIDPKLKEIKFELPLSLKEHQNNIMKN